MSDAATGWTDDRVELLAKLWSEGSSASQIAAILGGGVTRNAVIGKVHRLGLSGRVKAGAPTPARSGKSPRPLVGEPSAAPDAEPQAEAVALPQPAPVSDAVALPVSERVTILDLRESMCRWPIGDPARPEFGFCGHRAVTGLPYCNEHCRIAYQPAADRKRLRA